MTQPSSPETLDDDAVFSRLYTTHVRACRRAIRRRYLSLAAQWSIPADAYADMVAEATDEGFLALRGYWKNPGTDRSRPLALVVRIAHRMLGRQLQQAIRYCRRHVEAPSVTLPAPAPEVDTSPVVIDLLSRLHPRQAQALQGHYLQGLSVRDLAGGLDTTEAGVKCLLQRGRAHFRALWHEDDHQPASGGVQ